MCEIQIKLDSHEPAMVSVSNKEKPIEKSMLQRHKKIIIISMVTVVLIITLIFTLTSVAIQKQNDTTELIPAYLTLIRREDWSELPQTYQIPQLHQPIRFVIISHTAGRFCTTFDKCAHVVALIQKFHMVSDTPDIKYNFLIGGDGYIYEGRGWNLQNTLMDNTVNIAFIGNYVYDHLSQVMITALENLLNYGVESGKLNTDYILVSHNQTMNTGSPGRYVYKEIIKFSHYSSQFLYI